MLTQQQYNAITLLFIGYKGRLYLEKEVAILLNTTVLSLRRTVSCGLNKLSRFNSNMPVKRDRKTVIKLTMEHNAQFRMRLSHEVAKVLSKQQKQITL